MIAADPTTHGAGVGARIGPFRLIRQLGEGATAVVYEAVHETIGKRAAAKVLRPAVSADRQARERFVNEARAVSRVEHPGMVHVYDSGELADGTCYLLMELLEGETLAKRFSRRTPEGGRLPLPGLFSIVGQIAAALCAAHRQGIIHRDLKPENVFLVADPVAPGGERAKILDFGIAKFLIDSPESKRTAVGLLLGTPTYMSPEQCEGKEDLDARVDVYALGVMLYEALAGQPPFQAQMASSLMRQHMFKEPPPLREFWPDVPEDVAALIHQMLAKAAADRPTMEQVLVGVGAWQAAGAHLAPGRGISKKVLVGAMAAGVLLLCGGALLLSLGLRQHEKGATRPTAAPPLVVPPESKAEAKAAPPGPIPTAPVVLTQPAPPVGSHGTHHRHPGKRPAAPAIARPTSLPAPAATLPVATPAKGPRNDETKKEEQGVWR